MPLYDQQTSIKGTESEVEAWRDAADANSMPLNTWIRLVLDHAAGMGDLFTQLERAAVAREEEHAAEMRRARNETAAERRAERERRASGDLRKRGRKPKAKRED